MALRDWVGSNQPAIANPATVATPNRSVGQPVAELANVAVAGTEKNKKHPAVKGRKQVDWLKPCPLCGGRNFIHGYRGGYFCEVCQPGARPGEPVRAVGYRKKCKTKQKE